MSIQLKGRSKSGIFIIDILRCSPSGSMARITVLKGVMQRTDGRALLWNFFTAKYYSLLTFRRDCVTIMQGGEIKENPRHEKTLYDYLRRRKPGRAF